MTIKKISAVYSLISIPLILHTIGLVLLAYFSRASTSITSNIIISFISAVLTAATIFSIKNEKAYTDLKNVAVNEKHIHLEEVLNLMPKYYRVSRLGLYKILILLYFVFGVFPWVS